MKHVLYALALLAFITSESRAEETNLFGAHMQQPEIVVSSQSNNVLELTCKVPLLGGCCFPMTSHDVVASLEVPQGIAVVSGPEPAKYAAIEAPVSGTPKVWATFRWHLQQIKTNAEDELKVTVSSSDSGQVKAVYALGQQSRINITGPKLPDTLPAGQEVAIAVDAACLDQDRFVKSVRFWYSTEIPPNAEKIEAPPDLAGRGIMRFSTAGKQLMVQGQFIDLARKYEPTIWHGTLPAQARGLLYGIAVATDDAGKMALGPLIHTALPPAATGGKRWWIVAVVIVLIVPMVVSGLARHDVSLTVVGVALFVAAIIGFAWKPPSSPIKEGEPSGYPADSSTVAYLFLDQGTPSRLLAEQMETYCLSVPHRLHVLCFVEGVTPASIFDAYRKRFAVTKLPTVVFDGHASADGTNAMVVATTLDRCFGKPSPRLSMELHGGVMAGHELSLGFIMCNHASRKDAHGSVSAFAFENGVNLDGWKCDRVVRNVMVEGRQYVIPTGKCQPPAMMKWDIPASVIPAQTGALTVILDEQGKLIDSICTERPCTRTGICG
jgi:hypothetical protein